MSEKELHKLSWDRFISGDEAALLELYNQHYLGIINYGRTITNDPDFVNDSFMDMLLEFWNKRHTLPSVDNVRSYLMTSFRRQILHRMDAEKRRLEKQFEAQEGLDPFQVSYEEHLVKIHSGHHLKERIERALNKLTERQIELIRLKFFEDLDYDEIAQRCSITKRTAYNIVYDAIKQLKEELYDDRHQLFSLNFPLVLAALLHLIHCKSVS